MEVTTALDIGSYCVNTNKTVENTKQGSSGEEILRKFLVIVS